jgi:recombination protein RecT
MANPASVAGALAKTEKPKTLTELIRESTKELGKALPSHLSPERLTRIALTCIRLNPELSKCTPESFLGSLFTAAQLGIEPVAGRAYLLPFKNKRKIGNEWKTVLECQFVMGYKGLADLFYRHEKAVQLDWGIVNENDEFKYEYGTNAFLKHLPARKDRGETIGYYVIAKLDNGGRPFKYMSHEQCMDHGKKHSKTWLTKAWDEKQHKMVECEPHWAESSPWKTSEDSMCLKTVLIQLAKLLPLSVEMQRALAVDETSRDFKKGIGDALDMKETTEWKDDAVDTEAVAPEKEKYEPVKSQEEEIPFPSREEAEKARADRNQK